MTAVSATVADVVESALLGTPIHPKLPELLPKLAALEEALLVNDPKMPGHLKEIHKYLIGFEELSHLLSEDQIAVILEGQQRKLGVMLTEETKVKTSKGRALKKVTAEDL